MNVRAKRRGRGGARGGRSAGAELVVYVTKGNPECERLERYLVDAGISYVRRDVLAESGVMEEVTERTRGRVRLPAVRAGEVFLESQTPGSLSRFLRGRISRSP